MQYNYYSCVCLPCGIGITRLISSALLSPTRTLHLLRSKLHLVDLAGSERVAKNSIECKHLVDAKFINLSLHYLEGWS